MSTEYILINGKIYTEDPQMPWAGAVVVKDKKIKYVGDNDTALGMVGCGSEIIDLKNKTVIPGLIDGHTHPAAVAKTFWHVRIPLAYDKDELMAIYATGQGKIKIRGKVEVEKLKGGN